jgi:long-chain acyl-CoA synthetase
MTFEAFVDAGRDGAGSRFSSPTAQTLATLAYTAGTTGRPRAAMLTHGNLAAASAHCAEALPLAPDDAQLVFHPLAHVFPRLLIWTAIRVGCCTVIGRGPALLAADFIEAQPTVFAGVPSVFERIYGAASHLDLPRAVRWLGLSAEGFVESARRRGRDSGPSARRWTERAADRAWAQTLDQRIRARFGGRMRLLICGGAPLPLAIEEFFAGIGLPVHHGYGLTESCSAVCLNTPLGRRLATVGRPLPGAEVRIAADGEILVRGPHVMAGYWRDDEATRQALKEGWLHTGDVGEVDAEGFVRVTDRKKDIIVTASGRSVSPVAIESALREIPLVGHAVVQGDGRHYLTALLTLDPDAARAWAAEQGIEVASSIELVHHPRVFEYLRQQVAQVNRELSAAEGIKRFALLDEDFDSLSGEVTPTLQTRRRFVAQKYRALIEGLYDSSSSASASRPAVM